MDILTYEERRKQALDEADKAYPLTIWFIWYGHWIYKKNYHELR